MIDLSLPNRLAADGFAIVPDVLGPAAVASILAEIAEIQRTTAVRQRNKGRIATGV